MARRVSFGRPRASIVIVASNGSPFLERCLEQLATLETTVPFETIVVLNGRSREEPSWSPDPRRVRLARVETSEVNLGLAGALNLARTFASGEFLVSLHDDAQVAAGWLDALVETADREPDAGAVGSLVLDESLSVTAAGWELLPSGGARPFTFAEPPPVRTYSGARAVDFCQSCSLLVRATTWDQLGGADERFFPLYCVDVDLGLAIRARSQRVLVQPRSVVVHPGGSSTERDFGQFVNERNWLLLLAKWGEFIRSHEPRSDRTFAPPEEDVPDQEWNSDSEMRRRAVLARREAVTEDYAADLRRRLASRERELDELRAALETASTELDELRAELETASTELDSLRRRSERLTIIEGGRWWRLHERLMPMRRSVTMLRRALALPPRSR